MEVLVQVGAGMFIVAERKVEKWRRWSRQVVHGSVHIQSFVVLMLEEVMRWGYVFFLAGLAGTFGVVLCRVQNSPEQRACIQWDVTVGFMLEE